jgi:CBS domain-containing protein
MLDQHIGSVLVVDEAGQLYGIITESEFAAKEKGVPFSIVRLPQLFGEWMPPHQVEPLFERARDMTAGEVMNRDVVTVLEDDSLGTVLRLMLKHDIHHIPVVENGIPTGMIARHDLLEIMARSGQRQRS